MKVLRSGLTVAGVLGCLIEPRHTHACAGSVCASDQFVPRAGWVPSSLRAIAWQPGYDAQARSDERALPRFECVAADGVRREPRFVALPEDNPDHLELSDPLRAGERCSVTSGIADCSPDAGASTHLLGRGDFQVSDSSPMPEELGLIAVAGPRLGEVELAADASCSELVRACVVSTSVVFSEAALPWKDAFLFETIVDGQPFSTQRDLAVPSELGGLYHGRDSGLVYALIGDPPENVRAGTGLEAGEHTVAIQARLPGTDVKLTTPEVLIHLDCGHLAQVPLARSEVAAGSDGCSVTTGLGRSQRHASVAFASALAGVLLLARRLRRKRA